jgi:hypothetical protein
MNDSHFDYVDDPSLAWGEGESLGVVWADNARKDVYFQWFDAQGQPKLHPARNVSQTPRVFSWLPRVGCRPVRIAGAIRIFGYRILQ